MNAHKELSSIVDIAYQIIDLHEENIRLRADLEHYRPYQKMYFDELDKSINNSMGMIGTMLVAALDPSSIISMGHAAKEKQKAGAA
jgi:hypothetical protein